ncbi:hypothetical protein HYU72_00225 [Candidatus Berkelbacteria bacterium]|nr:hypothetical protein [Candidatus Berkelbacteria bacterium]
MTAQRFWFLLLVILALFFGGIYLTRRQVQKNRNREYQKSLIILKTTLQEYHQDQIPPQYPKTGENLENVLVPLYLDKMPVFPRGKPYHYQSDGQSFTLD